MIKGDHRYRALEMLLKELENFFPEQTHNISANHLQNSTWKNLFIFLHGVLRISRCVLSSSKLLFKIIRHCFLVSKTDCYDFFMASEVDDCIKRLMSHKGVTGVVVVNIDGVPIKSTLENPLAIQYTAQILQMVDKARNWVKEIDGSNDLTFLRLRTTKHEVVICPEGDYTIFVIQEPFTYQYL